MRPRPSPPLDDRRARIWLALFTRPGDELIGHLVARLGAAETAQRLAASRPLPGGQNASRIRAVLAKRYPQLPPLAHIDQTEHTLERRGLSMVLPADPHWPERLNDLGAAAPLLLCFRGDHRVLSVRRSHVAIVGTRTPSRQAVEATRDITSAQVRSGRTVVSGGARGIDATAHAVALESGVPTIAVVAQSPECPYPPQHRGLFSDIAQSGVVVGETLPGVRRGPEGFLARNRLIAALATVTIVTEAPIRSGAVSTAAHAARLERDLVAVTYPQHHPRNDGALRILEQWAGEELRWPG